MVLHDISVGSVSLCSYGDVECWYQVCSKLQCIMLCFVQFVDFQYCRERNKSGIGRVIYVYITLCV